MNWFLAFLCTIVTLAMGLAILASADVEIHYFAYDVAFVAILWALAYIYSQHTKKKQ
jgi:hypothetical protein